MTRASHTLRLLALSLSLTALAACDRVDPYKRADVWRPSGANTTNFELQVARASDAVAISYGERSWSYGELDEAANRLAGLLIRQGAGPGECVALLLERSAQAVMAMLAVLKTGAAYMAIDPALPAARIEFMLTDATPIAAITTAGLGDRLAGCDLAVIDIDDPRIDTQPGTALPAPRSVQVKLIVIAPAAFTASRAIAAATEIGAREIGFMTPSSIFHDGALR